MNAGNAIFRLSTVTGLLLASSCLGTAAMAQAQPAPAQPVAVQADQRPNVLILMLDDVGFGQLGSFGGIVETPNIDRVAARGVRYSNYHATPICSATRAAFLTGRNSHNVHLGGHPIFPSDAPGYDGKLPASAGTIAENLRQAGYATFALGKWDHFPVKEAGPSGPVTYWPLSQGFERYYGFLFSETDNFHPLLVRDNTPIETPLGDDYHLNVDLADQAIDMIRSRDGASPRRPFLMYFATGTAHAPHHASQSWIDRYRGRFDDGWDKARATVLQSQIDKGLVPAGTTLAPRPEGMPEWASLSADEKKIFARQMEAFAASLSQVDAEFGRVLDELQARGELDNTVILVTSDNGASAEGAEAGSFNELYFATGRMPDAEENLRHYDQWGGPDTYPHYAFGWAVAGNTPYRYYKQTTYEGGLRVPLILSAPDGAVGGTIDPSFIHVSDVVPTLLDLADTKAAETVNDTDQMPFDGISFAASVEGEPTAGPRKDQYFEVFGHRAFWSDGWKIVSPSRLNTWNVMAPALLDQPWQLYDLKADPGETTDLASQHPEIVERLAKGFAQQAERYNVFPITGQFESIAVQARRDAEEFAQRKGEWAYPGPISHIPKVLAPPIDRRFFTMTVALSMDGNGATGPIFASGGALGGMGFYIADGRPAFVQRGMDGSIDIVRAAKALPAGKHVLTLDVDRATDGPGKTITIKANGKVILNQTSGFSDPMLSAESFDVGMDEGTPVSPDYPAGTKFPGTIENIVFQLR